jgi:hypothetical protein
MAEACLGLPGSGPIQKPLGSVWEMPQFLGYRDKNAVSIWLRRQCSIRWEDQALTIITQLPPVSLYKRFEGPASWAPNWRCRHFASPVLIVLKSRKGTAETWLMFWEFPTLYHYWEPSYAQLCWISERSYNCAYSSFILGQIPEHKLLDFTSRLREFFPKVYDIERNKIIIQEVKAVKRPCHQVSCSMPGCIRCIAGSYVAQSRTGYPSPHASASVLNCSIP